MRYYNLDGTYRDDQRDVEFGWFLSDIAIDEANPTYKEHNEKIKKLSRLQKSLSLTESSPRSKTDECESFKSAERSDYVDDIEESVDALAEMESLFQSTIFSRTTDESIDIEVAPEQQTIHKIEPDVKIETPLTATTSQLDEEGFIENPETNFFKKVKSKRIPSKEEMMGLINPVNPESKALLSVISYAKYKSLNEKETNDEVLRTINFKATNSKHIISENDFRDINGLANGETMPNFNFLLNDEEIDADNQLVSEIRNYHATKEDNMLSLMMELIITDMDSNAGDMSELNHSVNEMNSTTIMETSDLGNSLHSSLMSKEGNGVKEDKSNTCNYLDIPNRSDILSSIGLSDDIDRSIEYFTKEKSDMHAQLVDIKKSFEEDERKIDDLINKAISLQNDLRETTYLDNLIHLLSGEPEKVKNKKLPFRIFHKSMDDIEANCNLII